MMYTNKDNHIPGQILKPMLLVVALCLSLLLVGGCDFIGGFFGEDSPPVPAPAPRVKQKVDAQKAKKDQAEEEEAKEVEAEKVEYHFSPKGKSDPFRPMAMLLKPEEEEVKEGAQMPLGPLQKLQLSQITLVAVVYSGDVKRALVEDSTGLGYIIEEGIEIGPPRMKGQVMKINPDSVEIKQITPGLRGGTQTKTVQLRLRPKEGE